MTHFTDSWRNLKPKPCEESIVWARTQPDWQTAWNNCERGDWMLYRLGRGLVQGSPSHRKLVGVVCQVARLALPYVAQGEKRPEAAIALAERFAAGENISITELRNAAAYAAAYAADAAYAAANAAYAAAYAADAAANAANAAYAAYAAAVTTPAKLKLLIADIVRAHYPEAPHA